MKTLAINSQKGGAGKTTLALNLASAAEAVPYFWAGFTFEGAPGPTMH